MTLSATSRISVLLRSTHVAPCVPSIFCLPTPPVTHLQTAPKSPLKAIRMHPPKNMPLWHQKYYEPKGIKQQQTQRKLPLCFLKVRRSASPGGLKSLFFIPSFSYKGTAPCGRGSLSQTFKPLLWVTFHWAFSHLLCAAQVKKQFVFLSSICLFVKELKTQCYR